MIRRRVALAADRRRSPCSAVEMLQHGRRRSGGAARRAASANSWRSSRMPMRCSAVAGVVGQCGCGAAARGRACRATCAGRSAQCRRAVRPAHAPRAGRRQRDAMVEAQCAQFVAQPRFETRPRPEQAEAGARLRAATRRGHCALTSELWRYAHAARKRCARRRPAGRARPRQCAQQGLRGGRRMPGRRPASRGGRR